jgi:GAF domain-containing protein
VCGKWFQLIQPISEHYLPITLYLKFAGHLSLAYPLVNSERLFYMPLKNNLTTQEKQEIVDLLVACPSMRNANGQQTIISMLCNNISSSLAPNQLNNRAFAYNLLDTCLNYSKGFDDLISSLRSQDGESIPFIALEKYLKRLEGKPSIGDDVMNNCPYVGLKFFQENDAHLFRRLDGTIDSLFNAVTGDDNNWITLTGSSGSGKSSLINAGLLPKLKNSEESIHWQICLFRFRQNPYESEAWFTNLLDKQYENVVTNFLKEQPTTRKVLFIIDQAEEFLIDEKEGAKQAHQKHRRIIEGLLDLTQNDYNIEFKLLLVLRTDFVGAVQDHELLGEIFVGAPQVLLRPLKEDSLKSVIEEPAKELGWTVEASLTQHILIETQGKPGSLPLIQVALTETWKECLKNNSKTLTLQAYKKVGGYAKALSTIADAAFNSLPPEQQEQAERVFIDLVHTGENTRITTRRIRTKTQIGTDDWKTVEEFAKPEVRLLVIGELPKKENGQAKREPTVEIIHEALIENWLRLRSWVNQYQKFIICRGEVEHQYDRWKTKKLDDNLLHGSLLDAAESYLDKIARPEIKDFIGQSLRNKEDKARSERRYKALFESATAISTKQNLEEVLDSITEQLIKITTDLDPKADECFSHIGRLHENGQQLDFVSACPREVKTTLEQKAQEQREHPQGRRGISMRSFDRRRTQLVPNSSDSNGVTEIHADADYISIHENIKVQLSTPIMIHDGIDDDTIPVGVLTIECSDVQALKEEHKKDIELLAGLAFNRIISSENTQEKFKALQQASLAVLDSLGLGQDAVRNTLRDELLKKIAEQALKVVKNGDNKQCFSHIALIKENILTTITANNEEAHEKLLKNPRVNVKSFGKELSISGRAVVEKKAQNVGNVKNDGNYIEIYDYINSQLSVPILLREEVLGVISVEHPDVSAFSKEDVINMRILAAQAAAAIYNVKRSRVAELLYQAGNEINKQFGKLEETLKGIVKFAELIVDTSYENDRSYSHIAFYRAGKPDFVVANPKHPEILPVIRAFGQNISTSDSEKSGIIGRAVETRTSQRHGNLQTNPPSYYVPADQSFNSQVSIPIMLGDQKPYAVLTIEHLAEDTFDDEDVKNLELLADIGAIAIYNALEREKYDQRRKMLGWLAVRYERLNYNKERKKQLEDLLDDVLNIANAEDSPGSFSHIALKNDNYLGLVGASSWGAWLAFQLSEHIVNVFEGNGNGGITRRAAQERKTQKVNSVKDDVDYIEIVPDIQSQLSAPIFVNKQVVGVLSLEHAKPTEFTPEHLAQIEELARQAALIIEAVQLF